ncbi:MAG: hypothetical protein ABSD44_06790 [Terracidiphilus sp.]
MRSQSRKDHTRAQALGHVGEASCSAAPLRRHAFPADLSHALPRTDLSQSRHHIGNSRHLVCGKSYTATIEGTGFNNQITCLALPLNITAADGTAVPYSSSTVKDATTLVVTGVEPPPTDPTETACVTPGGVSVLAVRAGPIALGSAAANAGAASAASPAPGTAGSTCTGQNGLLGITVQILGNEIHCDPSLNCTQDVISTTDGTPPPVQGVAAGHQIDVGQQIHLTTNPNLPDTIKPTKTTWTVGGTNIGNRVFGPLAANGSPTTASVTPTVLKDPSLSTYWLYPNDPSDPSANFPVTYLYCVDIPGLSAADVKNGLNCSLPAKAAFNVSGPSASVAPVLTTPDATNQWDVTDPNPACPMQFLAFGVYADEAPCPGATPAIPGIAFQENVADAGGGSFFWLQIVNSVVITSTAPGHRYLPNSQGPGLDNKYKYPGISLSGLEAFDAPSVELLNIYATKSEAFSANMYLMWRADADPSYIDVPVGYVNWSIKGKAENSGGSPPWALTPCGIVIVHPCAGAYAVPWLSSDPNGPAPDLPNWTSILTNTAGATNLSVQPDEEEEK